MPLGYNLRVNAPLEFDLIMQTAGDSGVPDADLIEAISYSSSNPYFRTAKFRQALITYRDYGCHTDHPKPQPTSRAISSAMKRRQKAAKG